MSKKQAAARPRAAARPVAPDIADDPTPLPPETRHGLTQPATAVRQPPTIPPSSQSVARSVKPQGTAPATVPGEEEVVAGPGIKVRATAVGYYGHARRRVGDVFTLRPRKGTFTELVLDKDGTPKLDKTDHQITREVPNKVLTAEAQFNPKWMERVDAHERERTTTANEDLRRKHDEILAGKMSGESPTGSASVLGDDED